MSERKKDEHPLNIKDLEKGVKYHLDQAQFYRLNGEYTRAKCYLFSACSLVEDDFLLKVELYRIYMMEKPFQITIALFWFENLFLSGSIIHDETTFREYFIKEIGLILVEVRHKWARFLPDSDLIRIFGRDTNHENHDSYVALWETLEPSKQISLFERFLSYQPEEYCLQSAVHLFVITEYKKKCNVVDWCMRWIELMQKCKKAVEKKVSSSLCLHEMYILEVLPILVNSDDYYEKLGPNDIIMKNHIIDAIHSVFFDYFVNDYDTDTQMDKNSPPFDDTSTVTVRRIFLLKLLKLLVAIDEHKHWNIFSQNDFAFTPEPDSYDQAHVQLKEFYRPKSDGKWSDRSVGFFVQKLSKFIEESFKKENDAFDLSAKQSDDYFKIVSYSIVFFLMLFDFFEVNIKRRSITERSLLSHHEDYSTVIKCTRKIRTLTEQPREFVGDDPETDKFFLNHIETMLQFDTSIDFIRKEFDIFASKIELDKEFSYLRFKICRALREEDYKTGLHMLTAFQPHILKTSDGKDLFWPSDPSHSFRLLQYHLEMLLFSIHCEDYHSCINIILRTLMILNSDVIDETVRFSNYGPKINASDPSIVYKKFAELLPVTNYSSSSTDSSSSDSNSSSDSFPLDMTANFFTKNPIVLKQTTLDSVVGSLVDLCIFFLSKLDCDLHIGYLLVLYQYHWPFYYYQFEESMQTLRQNLTPKSQKSDDPNQFSTTVLADPTQKYEELCKKPAFIFPPFKEYIYEYDILEQFKKLADEYDFLCQIEPGIYLTDTNQITAGLLETMNNKPSYPHNSYLMLNYLTKKIVPILEVNIQENGLWPLRRGSN